MRLGKNGSGGKNGSMSSEAILHDLDKRGILSLARLTLPDEVIVTAYRHCGPPSTFIDAPGGRGGVVPLGNDPESQRIEGILEAAVHSAVQSSELVDAPGQITESADAGSVAPDFPAEQGP